ncbi:acyl-CoA desaturase [Pseudomonas sp. EA_35y_Pfl2_R5]|uniref:acyl-CoA desaturase n=1 Tax=Pseudomonas sp. EA_35y_Pfl2_R5 TaxID=3088690 RepID=UPI0030DAE9CA
MDVMPESLKSHRVQRADVVHGEVRWEPVRSLWFTCMALGALVGGALTFNLAAFALFAGSTALVLLLGHSLGMHRKLIHDSFQCPKWLEYFFVYCGVLVGLSGPLGLLRTHDLRDFAQRQKDCHDFFGHRRPPLQDAWWQLHCELRLDCPPIIQVEARIAADPVYRFLQRTWMAQQLPWALLFFALGGWAWVFWGVCARIAAGVFGHWLIGHFAHRHGEQQHVVEGASVQGFNVPFSALLTMGECWHNNHHAFPGSARLGLYAGEWDPGWWVLQGLQRLGLVWGLKTPEDLPHRPELRKIVEPAKSSCDCRVRVWLKRRVWG